MVLLKSNVFTTCLGFNCRSMRFRYIEIEESMTDYDAAKFTVSEFSLCKSCRLQYKLPVAREAETLGSFTLGFILGTAATYSSTCSQ